MEQHQILAGWKRRIKEACVLIQWRHTSDGLILLDEVAAEIYLAQIMGLPSDPDIDEPERHVSSTG